MTKTNELRNKLWEYTRMRSGVLIKSKINRPFPKPGRFFSTRERLEQRRKWFNEPKKYQLQTEIIPGILVDLI